MNASQALKHEENAGTAAGLKTVQISKDMAQIDDFARELRGHGANLRYTFRDESPYTALTYYFTIRMVAQAIPLTGANMDHVKMHVNQILAK